MYNELCIPDATVYVTMQNGESKEQAIERMRLTLKKTGIRILNVKSAIVEQRN